MSEQHAIPHNVCVLSRVCCVCHHTCVCCVLRQLSQHSWGIVLCRRVCVCCVLLYSESIKGTVCCPVPGVHVGLGSSLSPSESSAPAAHPVR